MPKLDRNFRIRTLACISHQGHGLRGAVRPTEQESRAARRAGTRAFGATWCIGLTETVSGHTFFLHDGCARSLLEAILWHGGEAEAAKERVVAMNAEERAALLAFLRSL